MFCSVGYHPATMTLFTLIDLRESFFHFLLHPDSGYLTTGKITYHHQFHRDSLIESWDAPVRQLCNMMAFSFFTNAPYEEEHLAMVNKTLQELEEVDVRKTLARPNCFEEI